MAIVDMESDASDDPDKVAHFAHELTEAGAAGITLEDGRSHGTLTDPHTAKIATVHPATPGLFINARTDPYGSSSASPRPACPRPSAAAVATARPRHRRRLRSLGNRDGSAAIIILP